MSMREIKIKPLLRKRAMRVVIGLSLMIGLGGALLLLTIPNPLFSNTYSTLLYSKDGDLLGARIAPDGQWRFPQATNSRDA